MTSFRDWKEAYTAAVHLARELGREVGVLKAKEYDKTVFQVIHLPRPENRFLKACGVAS